MLDREYERVITDDTENNVKMRTNVAIIRRESRQTDMYLQVQRDERSKDSGNERKGSWWYLMPCWLWLWDTGTECEGNNRNESGTTIQIRIDMHR